MLSQSLSDRFGICQWFHFGDDRLLEATIRTLQDLGIRHLRTGISWADWHRPGGKDWYKRQMGALREGGIEVLLNIYFTPPSLSMDPSRESCAVPPAESRALADFVDTVINLYGDSFSALELWNEPNSRLTWDSRYDPGHRHLARSLAQAGFWARERGKKAVFGGIAHPDYAFVEKMRECEVFGCFDVLGVHAFPHMWEPHATGWELQHAWHGWEHRIQSMSKCAGGMPVWVTEAGLATYDKALDRVCREDLQVEMLLDAMRATTERFYWYTLFDLDPEKVAVEEANGANREEAEYHLGLIRYSDDFRVEGNEKPAYFTLREALAAAVDIEQTAA